MLFFTSSNIIAMSIIVYLCVVAPTASGKIGRGTATLSRYRTDASQTKPIKPARVPKPAHDNRHNTSSTSAQTAAAEARRKRNGNKGTQRDARPRKNMSKVRPRAGSRVARPTPTKRRRQNEQPTPEPTGDASTSTTVYTSGSNEFALLLPRSPGGGYPTYSIPVCCDSFLRAQRWCPMPRKTVSHTVRMKVGAETLSQSGSSQGLRTWQRRMDRTYKWVQPFWLSAARTSFLEVLTTHAFDLR